MKKVLILAAAILISPITQAQNDQEVVDFFQSVFGMEKKAIVNEFMNLEDDAATSFWELYDAYEVERKAQGRDKFELLNEYIDNYFTISDESANNMVKEAIALRKSKLKLISKYYKKINKSNGGKTAAQFYQIENYFNNTINLAITENIPFVGEMD